MADTDTSGDEHAHNPRTSVKQQPPSSPPLLTVQPASSTSPSPSQDSEEPSMPLTRSSNRTARGTTSPRGAVRATRSSGRLGQPPTKLRRVITPDEDEDMESEDDGTSRPTRRVSRRGVESEDNQTGPIKAEQDTSAIFNGDDEEDDADEDEDMIEEDEEQKLPEESDDLTPPPPSPTPSPPKKPNLRIKVKFEGKTPINARPATARSAKGKGRLPFATRGKADEVDSEDSPPALKPGTRATRARAIAAPSSTPAVSATPAESIEPTPAPDDEDLSPVPDTFEGLDEEDMSLSPSATRKDVKMDEDEEDEEDEQDELEDEQPEEEEEEEELEAEEEEAAVEEPEEEDDDDDDDEEMSVPPPGRMTARQAAMKGSGATVEFIELPTGPGKKKHFTPQEIELRKQEQSRKRSLQSAQKLEDEKQATIRRLLSKQTPRTRGSRSGVSSVTAPGSSGDGSATPQLPPVPILARWVSTKDGMRWAVPPEGKWLAYVGPVKRVVPGRMQEIKGEDDADTEAVEAPEPAEAVQVEPAPPPRARLQALCTVDGCGELRKYRSVKDFEKGACGLEHLKAVNAMIV